MLLQTQRDTQLYISTSQRNYNQISACACLMFSLKKNLCWLKRCRSFKVCTICDMAKSTVCVTHTFCKCLLYHQCFETDFTKLALMWNTCSKFTSNDICECSVKLSLMAVVEPVVGSGTTTTDTAKHLKLVNKNGKGKFLYSAVSSTQNCSNHFTIYSLADLFKQTPSQLL